MPARHGPPVLSTSPASLAIVCSNRFNEDTVSAIDGDLRDTLETSRLTGTNHMLVRAEQPFSMSGQAPPAAQISTRGTHTRVDDIVMFQESGRVVALCVAYCLSQGSIEHSRDFVCPWRERTKEMPTAGAYAASVQEVQERTGRMLRVPDLKKTIYK